MERVRIEKRVSGFERYHLEMYLGECKIGLLTYNTYRPSGIWIEYLWVRPELRRKGYATTLMNKFFNLIGDYKGNIGLQAVANWDSTSLNSKYRIKQADLEKFYCKFGFAVVKRDGFGFSDMEIQC